MTYELRYQPYSAARHRTNSLSRTNIILSNKFSTIERISSNYQIVLIVLYERTQAISTNRIARIVRAAAKRDRNMRLFDYSIEFRKDRDVDNEG